MFRLFTSFFPSLCLFASCSISDFRFTSITHRYFNYPKHCIHLPCSFSTPFHVQSNENTTKQIYVNYFPPHFVSMSFSSAKIILSIYLTTAESIQIHISVFQHFHFSLLSFAFFSYTRSSFLLRSLLSNSVFFLNVSGTTLL